MRIISVNVNGIQAAVERGLFSWLQAQNADVICLQDTRASAFELDDPTYQLDGYFLYASEAEVPSQGGVALYSRLQPKAVIGSLGFETADRYGRYLQADFDKVSIASLLLPTGQGGDEPEPEVQVHGRLRPLSGQAAPQAPRIHLLRLAVRGAPEAGREELARLPAAARLPGAGARLDGPDHRPHGLRGCPAGNQPRGRPLQLVAGQRTGGNAQSRLALRLSAADPGHAPLRAQRPPAPAAALLPACPADRRLRLAAEPVSDATPEKAGHAGFFWSVHFTRRRQKG
ncbi:endonuclease/exonuclease/phosphatase family protein [Azotobacter chroococcum]